MDIWDLMSYVAWGVSGLLLLWIVADAIGVSRQYDEDFLMSSREGADDLVDK